MSGDKHGASVPECYCHFMVMDVLGLRPAEITEMMRSNFIQYMHAIEYSEMMVQLRRPPQAKDKKPGMTTMTFSENANADIVPGELAIVPNHKKVKK